ncbi:C40 family peptidase [Chryseomicrobium sp. FSL W7-1435]|uniref:C40 family peptidase n=1 Tax=Chryseomicrobium sp. FSL W7-1435 TaxID=2921704 RepID=UPI003159A201
MNVSSTKWVCSVSVATVWTSPESPREIDQFGFDQPVKMAKWIEKLGFEELLDLCEGNRVQTQLLYGDPVHIDAIEGNWAKVVCEWQSSKKDQRGYPGWVPLHQLTEVDYKDSQELARIAVNKAQLWTLDKEPFLVVPFNTFLPVRLSSEEFTTVITPHGEMLVRSEDIEVASSRDEFTKRDGVAVLKEASQFLDLPYFWGGMSSYGYDCSGFSSNMLRACGYSIPRDASDQAVSGIEINSGDETQWLPGDLLFFANDERKGNVRHVGIYSGNGQMIHSPSTGQSIEYCTLAGTKFVKELCAVRRYARVN